MNHIQFPFTHASAQPETRKLTDQIQNLVKGNFYREDTLIDLIRSYPDSVRADFYAGYKIDVNHFMADRCVLRAGTEDEIVTLVRNNAGLFDPKEFHEFGKTNDIISSSIRRGLTRVIDTMIEVTPEKGREFFTSQLGIWMSPDHDLNPHVANECGQNYLRSLDHLIAKGFDINGDHERHWEPQLVVCALYPSLLPELEKRGADLEKAIEEERYSAGINPQYTQRLSALEDYKAAKALGRLANTGDNWADVRANSEPLQELWREIHGAYTSNAPESDIISIINRNPVGMTAFKALARDLIHKGLPEALGALVEKCEVGDKARLATSCLGDIGANFSAAEKPEPVEDAEVMACLEKLRHYGADLKQREGTEMLVLVAEKNRRDLIPPLVARGTDLAAARDLAKNSYIDDGYSSYPAYPAAQKLLRSYRLPRRRNQSPDISP